VLAGLRIDDKPGQSKVNQVDSIGLLAQTHHYVVGLDVPVNVVPFMHVLDSLEQLIEEHEGGF